MSYSSTSRRHGVRRKSQPAPLTTRNWAPASPELIENQGKRNVVIDCGWGRLIFAHTFTANEDIVDELKHEEPDRRDIAMYLRDPHVVLSMAPQDLFLDPSHTFRLSLDQYRPARRPFKGFFIRQLTGGHDPEQVNRILGARGMVPIAPSFLHRHRMSRTLTFLVAEDETTGSVIGFVMGVDHKRAFGDAEGGSSLWSLAVDPQAQASGVGEALVRQLAESYVARNRAFMDLSVMHDNDQAIALYKKLGFRRVPVFTIKGKNSINEKLFTGPQVKTGLNPYAQLIVDEARRRGIHVSVIDADNGYFALTYGGRRIVCRESLSELTTAIAMSRCDDKSVTRRLLSEAGLSVPAQRIVTTDDEARDFLEAHDHVVVKPARGEQGAGISVDLEKWSEVKKALKLARQHADKVIMEEYVTGRDLRIIVIDYKVVAAAIRRPARIVGNGRDTVERLIEKQSRRRAAATGGESKIPTDAETERCLKAAGYAYDDVPAEGEAIIVRKTANLHTGGTIHDVTDRLHPRLIDAAVRGAQALDIPVVGFDFLVPDITGPDYVIIEANERPGLANHEPQPTAERFIDLLFPQTIVR